jgi:biotin transport system substrate-specific component
MLTNFKITKSISLNYNKSLAKDIISVLLFSILTGISAGFKIGIGAIPITMQTLIVLLSGAYLGSKKGAISQLTYLTIGITGIPWFSMGGGLAYILSPTFGYLVGFIPASYIIGMLIEKNRNILNIIKSFIFGNFFIYSFGILWLSRIFDLSKSLTIGLYPFIVGDILKTFLAIIILKNIKK